MTEHAGESKALAVITQDTTDAVFEMAGGFGFTDEIALGLNAKWRKQSHGPIVVSAVDLAWLLDGYARARMGYSGRSESSDGR